jgi:uracil-DNA glycosylase family 4
MSDELRRELRIWLGYLRDIGVRELRAAEGEREPRRVPEAAAVEPRGATDPAGGAGVPRTRDLFSIPSGPGGGEHDPERRLREIREDLGECTRCALHAGRTNLVFGVGDPHARLMFVGEGPGADEDAQGEPFVGRAGQKLNEMIRAIGLRREEVYIANVVKCRPPDNREPRPEEIATCSPFLFAQIEAIRPKVIVTLGAPATRTLLGTRVGITRLRGTWQDYRGIPVMPTYHPAYLLRAYTPENRRKVWEDLKAARDRLDEGR